MPKALESEARVEHTAIGQRRRWELMVSNQSDDRTENYHSVVKGPLVSDPSLDPILSVLLDTNTRAPDRLDLRCEGRS